MSGHIHERSNIIPISPSSPTKNSEKDLVKNLEYSLKANFFDPSKSSPPNEFLKNLQRRMNIYNAPTSFTFIKDDNCEIK